MYAAQVQNAHSVKNLTALCLISAVQVMQLVQAREQPQGLAIQDGFDEVDVSIIQGLNQKLEGNTDKLKNPHPPQSMAFASWVVARLGGWSGYASQRPPGPKTMWDGLQRLKIIAEGVQMLELIKLE
ncbi:MAG: hypothetical protein ACRBG0_22580 [Lewinella sp.]|uniref:hypothetical protein n=1 Tax=Lewinella sp. TaxID=2004506 RepID=UPI003D6A3279